ncbi:MAG: hypothetical protein AAGA48_23940 [Myxococcota bacterium]
MNETDFLDPRGDEFFSSTASVRHPKDLLKVDVIEFNRECRHAVSSAIRNAQQRVPSPGARISLVLGHQGTGKTHLVTAVINEATSAPTSKVFPAIIQLTAQVERSGYESWLQQAIVRSLGEASFLFPTGEAVTPLQRLSHQLLERVDVELRERLTQALDEDEDEELLKAALVIGKRLRKFAVGALDDSPPSYGLFAAVVLAGLGYWPAVSFLRNGTRELPGNYHLEPVETPTDRVRMIHDLAVVVQLVEATLVVAFDQIENVLKLADASILIHAVTQAVRLAEAMPNVSIVLSVVQSAYEAHIQDEKNLSKSDLHRIADEAPSAVTIPRPSPDVIHSVVARRIGVLADLLGQPRTGTMDPLPDWVQAELPLTKSVRVALQLLGSFREKGQLLGRFPTRKELGLDDVPAPEPVAKPPPTDFDKKWADHRDGSLAMVRVSDLKKIELIEWFVRTAHTEHHSPFTVETSHRQLSDSAETRIADIVVSNDQGQAVMRKAIALCDAPNRNQGLANQIEAFLQTNPHYPYALRSRAFPKSKTALAAKALQKLESLQGHRLEIGEDRWHILHEARDFYEQMRQVEGFHPWRRDGRWLTTLFDGLDTLLRLPEVPQPSPQGPPDSDKTNVHLSEPDGAFPLLVGHDGDGAEVYWDPYRPDPDRLNNFGFLVTGDPGAGKTQTIKVLIDAACNNQLPVCIFDFKRDYCDPDFTEAQGLEVVDVSQHGLPFNPVQPPQREQPQLPMQHAYELAGVLKRVFGLGPVQEGNVRDAIATVYRKHGIDPQVPCDPSTTTWPVFAEVVEMLKEGGANNAALLNRIGMLVDLNLVPRVHDRDQDFAEFVDKRVTLLLSGLPSDEMKSALAEMLIIQLHAFALRGDHPRRLKRLVVFDEAHRVAGSEKLQQLAREGRAFGVGTVIGTQFPGDIPEETAGNLATRLFLMNNQARHRATVVRQVYATTAGKEARGLAEQLSGLAQLQGLYMNVHYGSTIVRVHPYFKRVRERAGQPPGVVTSVSGHRPTIIDLAPK